MATTHNFSIEETSLIKCNKFTIRKNNFLQYDTEAFFHCYYVKGEPNNPDFLLTLKNNYGTEKEDNLIKALKSLFEILSNDLPGIIFDYGITTICVVPRSKADFPKNKMIFRSTVNWFIEYLNNPFEFVENLPSWFGELEVDDDTVYYLEGVENGVEYILRHTNTKTTHLTHSERARMAFPNNDGDMPYVGITKNTCHISEKVKGKTILLIDDIYTKSMNIDEDCIQALYDFGAKKVFLYTVAYTKDKFSSPSSTNIDDKIKEIFSRYKI